MKRLTSLLSIIILSFCSPVQLFAQPDFSDDPYFNGKFTIEMGASIGAMNCLTDLGGGKGIGKKFVKDVNVGSTQPEGSIFFSIVYKNAVVLRLENVWGIVKAKDAVLKSVKESTGGRYERNLSFRSAISEIGLIAEIHPRYFKNYTRGERLPRVSPYLLGGIGYFAFNPTAKLDSERVELRPLSTEGQGFAEYPDRKLYKLKQFNFPVGAGIKYKLNEMASASVECVYRILNTDYLDDVSTSYIDKNIFQNHFSGQQLTQVLALYNRQKEINPSHVSSTGDVRGNPKNNDAYFSINFKLAFIF